MTIQIQLYLHSLDLNEILQVLWKSRKFTEIYTIRNVCNDDFLLVHHANIKILDITHEWMSRESEVMILNMEKYIGISLQNEWHQVCCKKVDLWTLFRPQPAWRRCRHGDETKFSARCHAPFCCHLPAFLPLVRPLEPAETHCHCWTEYTRGRISAAKKI